MLLCCMLAGAWCLALHKAGMLAMQTWPASRPATQPASQATHPPWLTSVAVQAGGAHILVIKQRQGTGALALLLAALASRRGADAAGAGAAAAGIAIITAAISLLLWIGA